MKYIMLILFILFIPHYVVWGTVLISGFSIDYKDTFNSEGFWCIACLWWLIGGIAGCAVLSKNPKFKHL
jgi:hypothetical protein